MGMRKKAAIEVQFNWMFVLVAGAIILSFFVVFVMKQKEASDQKLSAALIKDLETKITSARVSGGSAAELDLHDLEILFTCQDYRMQGVSESINYRAIFTPDRVKGKSLLLWSMPWSIPFKVTNLLFITSPGVRYVILDTNSQASLVNAIYQRMSNKFFTVDLVDESTFNAVDVSDGYKVKVVCVDCDTTLESNLDLSRFVNFPDADVRAVSINPNTNKINFYVMNGSNFAFEGESPFFGTDADSEATMYAAIFSDGKDVYDCNMRKALDNFRIVAEVYKSRMEAVQNDSMLSPVACRDYYSRPESLLAEMISSAGREFSSESNVVVDLSGKAKDLEIYQNNYIRRMSCPLIY